jgi:undecaprenyl phosphate N,N'-diacetylbacillosamine 1-phosphate transferase
MYQNIFKPLIDFVFAFAALLILSPLLIFVAIALALANNGSPFFFQLRPGKNKDIFKIIKFKTMTDTRDTHGNLLPDEARITSIGKFVRKTSIDEIPQLINVLLGEMSIIGPRPLLVEYLPLYNKIQNKRHLVKPGITGWAQVNGRNSVSWEDKFKLDVYYVENINFLLDIRIILKTIKKVIISEGISAEGHATMPTFSEYLKQKENS